jgi:RNAse (barnase) inhibitor barstar
MTMAVDLTVRGESVERVFSYFTGNRFLVNRRYQRKLIWTLEEKRNFIDSLIKGYPVPIILLAENAKREDNTLEIIDGMQRLDAVVSFISNKYAVQGHYFDLNAVAHTKALLDSGILEQQHPIMERAECVSFASYLLPLSIYEFADEGAVDTVFRRINSGGRQLSRQELRAAGSTDHFATIVRRLSAKMRGDDSYSDILRLNDMQKISITNRDLNYGIDVDKIFWVSQGILRREDVRQSRDEELVADIVAYMLSNDPISSRTEFLDDFYGMNLEKASQDRFTTIDEAIKRRSVDLVIIDFQRTLDQIRLALENADDTFARLIFTQPPITAARYFQVIFLAFYELIIKQNLEVSNRALLVQKLRRIGDHLNIQGSGGRWGANDRQANIESAIGMLQACFSAATSYDPAVVHWITQLQNLLSQSYTEQAAYDFKQGFIRLDGVKSFDDDSFEKILKTCVAISNIGQSRKGYVLIGIAENIATANRIETLFGIQCRPYQKFFVSGIEHEAVALGKNLDQFFQLIVNKIEQLPISQPLKSYITSNIKSVRYYEKTVYILEVVGQEEPSLYNGSYYQRSGANVVVVETKDFPAFFKKYTAK